MVEPQCLRHDQTRGRRADERYGDRFTRKLETAALIAEAGVGRALSRDPLAARDISPLFVQRRVRPQFRGRPRIRQRVEADCVEVVRGAAEAALDDPQEFRRRNRRGARDLESKPQNASPGSPSPRRNRASTRRSTKRVRKPRSSSQAPHARVLRPRVFSVKSTPASTFSGSISSKSAKKTLTSAGLA